MSPRVAVFCVPRFLHYACVAMVAFFSMASSVVFGQDSGATATLEALDRLDTALPKEPGLTSETKDALQALIEALRAERTSGIEAGSQVPAQPSQVSKEEVARLVEEHLTTSSATRERAPREGIFELLTTYGDLRLRAESNVNLDGNPARHRQRVRLRVGTNYQLTDEILVGARIATGDPGDAQSPHQTLGNVFHGFDISLDRAFLTYRPGWLQGGWVTAGKFSHPFYQNPVYSELVWDADVQPEGVVAGYTFSERGPLESFALTAGEYLLLEQPRGDEGTASVFQVSGRFRMAEHLRANFGAAYYLYSKVTPSGSRTILAENGGNATLDLDGDGNPDDFRSRFAVLNPIVGFTYDGWKLPLTFSAEYILNTRARIQQDQGWAAGASLGKAQNHGDWRVYYQWQVIQQDAVFTPFAQDDFLFATNHRSHVSA